MKGKQLSLDILSKEVAKELGRALPKLPKNWKWVRLGDVCEINPSKRELASSNGELQVTFIPMSAVDEVTGTIQSPSVRCLEQVKKGYTYFREGDVLFAKITPCMENGKAAIAIDLVNELGFGSTEFHVIRPSIQITAEWVYHYIRRKSFRELAAKSMTGSVGQQRVPDDFLRSVEVPLPPLEEQKRIAARVEEILSRVEQAKKLREEALKDAEAIMKSALYEVFSRAEERGWQWTSLMQVCRIDCESRNPSVAAPNEEFAYIDISGIESGTGKIREVKKILGKDAPSRARRVIHTNDVIMSTVRPYLKSLAIIPEEYDNQICSTGFAVLSCGQSMLPKYLLYGLFWDGVIDQCNKMMIGAHYPALNSRQVAEIRIPVASIAEQRSIITYLDRLQEKVEMLKQTQSKTKEELEAIIPTVLDRAFRGEL